MKRFTICIALMICLSIGVVQVAYARNDFPVTFNKTITNLK